MRGGLQLLLGDQSVDGSRMMDIEPVHETLCCCVLFCVWYVSVCTCVLLPRTQTVCVLFACLCVCVYRGVRVGGGGRGSNSPPIFIVLGAELPHFSSMHAYSHIRSTQLRAH